MKLKTIEHDGQSYAVISEGKPVYIDDNGSETTYDPVAMHATISRLNKESQTHREAKEAAEEGLKVFEGLDPEAAKKALDTVKNLDDKKLVDAGDVERIKNETASSFQKKLDEATAENEKLRNQYSAEKVNAAFAGSKFIKEKLAVPADMAQATFGKHFVFKDGTLNPVDGAGNPIYSDSNPGEVASFDEALEKIVGGYAYKDSILKGSGHSGSGTEPPGKGGASRTVTRKQFESMPPAEQHKLATSEGVKIVD